MFHPCRYGRRFVLLLSLTVQFLFGVGAAFSPNFYVYIALRFVVGITISGITITTNIIGNDRVHNLLIPFVELSLKYQEYA